MSFGFIINGEPKATREYAKTVRTIAGNNVIQMKRQPIQKDKPVIMTLKIHVTSDLWLPDITLLASRIIGALTGIAYEMTYQVVDLHCLKQKSKKPHVSIVIDEKA